MLDKKIFLIAVVLMTGLLPIKDYAQSYDANSTPMSGNATAADKFASIPVNLYTGVAPVSVPLYSYSTQSGLHTGFSLNYFLGGIQANESGTPVGMGWFLEGGGIITRTVRGMPDDMGAKGYIYSNSASIFSIPNQSKLYYDTMDAEQDVFQFNFNGRSGKFFIGKNKQIIIGSLTKLNIQYSTAADSSISSFTVIEEDGAKYVFDQIESQSITAGFACGYNSKTYNTGWQLSKMVSPFVTDTIKFSYNTVYRSDYNVPYPQSLLIKADGTVYRSFSPTGFIYTVSKKIGSVSFPDGKKLEFAYDSTIKYDGYDSVLSVIRVTDSLVKYGYTLNYSVDGNSKTFLTSITHFTRSAKKTIYSFAYNSSVANSNNIDHWGFYNAASNGSNLVPSVSGVYSSGANRDGASTNNAGALTAITDASGGTTVYQTESNDVIQVGPNVQTVNGTLTTSVSWVTVPVTLNQINGTYNFTATLASSARTGTYPFGGYCQLVIDVGNGGSVKYIDMPSFVSTGSVTWTGYGIPNGSTYISIYMNTGGPGCTISRDIPVTVTWQNNSVTGYSRPGAGLRIARILHVDPSASQTDTLATYSYRTTDGKSSGFLCTIPKYDFPYQETVINGSTTTTNYTTISSSPVSNFNYTQGSPVGYSRVEVIKGATNHNSGKEVYEFTGLTEAGMSGQIPSFPYAPIIQRDWIMGLPKRISIYDSSGHLLKVTTNVYDSTIKSYADSNFLSLKLGKTTATYYGNPLTSGTPVTEYFTGQSYSQECGRANLSLTTDSIFNLNGSIQVNQQTFQYDTNYNVIKITTPYNKTKGLSLEKRIYYPYNYTLSGVIGTLRTNNIINVPVSTETWITGDSNPRILGAGITDFQQTGQGYIKPSYSYSLQSNAPIAQSTIGSFNAASLVRNTTWIKPTNQYTVIDSKGNLVESIDVASTQSSSQIMDYKQQFVIAKVSNAKNGDIAYTSFEADGSGNWTIGSALRDTTGGLTGKKGYNLANGSLSKSGLNTALTYIVSVWAKSGASISVNGNSIGSSIALQNGWYFYTKNTSSVSSITISGTGIIDEVRLYPSNANMVTYAYDPFTGVTNTADANSTVSSYEYDIINRLNIVRDKDLNILKKYEYADSTTAFTRIANWQATGATRCVMPLNATQEIEQIDANFYSDTYKNKKWVFGGASCTTCAPVCTGPAYKWLNCVCEAGVRHNLSTVNNHGTWQCTYVYCFSDGSSSSNQTENSGSACGNLGGCNTQ